MEIREEEFERAINGLTRAMEVGFAGVHRRQDITNGRLDEHEDAIRELQIERAERRGRESARTYDDDGRPALTHGDMRKLKALWAFLGSLVPVGIWIWSLIKP